MSFTKSLIPLAVVAVGALIAHLSEHPFKVMLATVAVTYLVERCLRRRDP